MFLERGAREATCRGARPGLSRSDAEGRVHVVEGAADARMDLGDPEIGILRAHAVSDFFRAAAGSRSKALANDHHRCFSAVTKALLSTRVWIGKVYFTVKYRGA